MKHILFIDELERLNLKKDSSLMLANALKKAGVEVYLLFEKDFYVANNIDLELKVYSFESVKLDGYYLKDFKLADHQLVKLVRGDVLHMRIDPPFDTRYLRYLWMLRFLQTKGVKVLNNPDGILKYNEKLHAYTQPNSLPSFVGSSVSGFENFVSTLSSSDALILKPLDLFQGFGVEKVLKNDPHLIKIFMKKVEDNKGAIVVQPFNPEVEKGEIRSLYFKGSELGSILKVPKKGEFLANIAQGASFHAIELEKNVKADCDRICKELKEEGVDWVAFDIMGNNVSEVNITCPGLLVEVSYAHQKDFAEIIANSI